MTKVNLEVRERLAHLIVQIRESKHYSQRELAREMGVSPNAIRQWENCASFPGYENLKKISEVTGFGNVSQLEQYLYDEGKENATVDVNVLLDQISALDKRQFSKVVQLVGTRLQAEGV